MPFSTFEPFKGEPAYKRLLERRRSYDEKQYQFTLSQKIDFINQLEEQSCILFLKKEGELQREYNDFSNIFIHHELMNPIISFLKELDEISKQLEEERKKDCLISEKEKTALILGCNDIQYIQEGNKLKIFKPDNNVNDFLVGVEMGIASREKASIRSTAAFLVDKALGLNLVPETVVGTYQGKEGSIQEFVEGVHFYEKKFFKISEKKSSDLICNYGIEEFENAIICDALGRGKRLPLCYGLLLESPLERDGNNAPICKNGIPLTKNKIKVFFLLGKISLGKKQLYKTNEIDFSNPMLQKLMIDAQIFDFIIGQLDRSASNFIFIKKENSTSLPEVNLGKSLLLNLENTLLTNSSLDTEITLKLLDHDYTFSSQFKKLDLKTKEILSKESILTELPPLVDGTTTEKVLALDFQKLRKELLGGGLTMEEVDACENRWEILKTHLQYLKLPAVFKNSPQEKIILEWNEETYRFLIQGRKNSQGETIYNNYISKNIQETEKRSTIFNLLQKYQKQLNMSILQ